MRAQLVGPRRPAQAEPLEAHPLGRIDQRRRHHVERGRVVDRQLEVDRVPHRQLLGRQRGQQERRQVGDVHRDRGGRLAAVVVGDADHEAPVTRLGRGPAGEAGLQPLGVPGAVPVEVDVDGEGVEGRGVADLGEQQHLAPLRGVVLHCRDELRRLVARLHHDLAEHDEALAVLGPEGDGPGAVVRRREVHRAVERVAVLKAVVGVDVRTDEERVVLGIPEHPDQVHRLPLRGVDGRRLLGPRRRLPEERVALVGPRAPGPAGVPAAADHVLVVGERAGGVDDRRTCAREPVRVEQGVAEAVGAVARSAVQVDDVGPVQVVSVDRVAALQVQAGVPVGEDVADERRPAAHHHRAGVGRFDGVVVGVGVRQEHLEADPAAHQAVVGDQGRAADPLGDRREAGVHEAVGEHLGPGEGRRQADGVALEGVVQDPGLPVDDLAPQRVVDDGAVLHHHPLAGAPEGEADVVVLQPDRRDGALGPPGQQAGAAAAHDPAQQREATLVDRDADGRPFDVDVVEPGVTEGDRDPRLHPRLHPDAPEPDLGQQHLEADVDRADDRVLHHVAAADHPHADVRVGHREALQPPAVVQLHGRVGPRPAQDRPLPRGAQRHPGLHDHAGVPVALGDEHHVAGDRDGQRVGHGRVVAGDLEGRGGGGGGEQRGDADDPEAARPPRGDQRPGSRQHRKPSSPATGAIWGCA